MSPRKSERNATGSGTRTEHRTTHAASSYGDGDGLQRRANCDYCPRATDADHFRAANRADSRGGHVICARGAQTPYKVDLAMNFKVWLELSCSPLERSKGRIVGAVSQTGRRRVGVANLGSDCTFRFVSGLHAFYKAALSRTVAMRQERMNGGRRQVIMMRPDRRRRRLEEDVVFHVHASRS